MIEMNINKDLIKGIQKRMKKFDDVDRVILDYSKLRGMTYEEGYDLLKEFKRYGSGFNTSGMDIERHIKRAIKKDKGDDKMKSRDLHDLVEYIAGK